MKRGFLNPRVITKIAFWTTSACILIAVVACLLAIWDFAKSDVLWRTVATCAVIGGGMVAFYVINGIFDRPSE
jgi:membrane protein YdbS with pleckstrin-like domain